MFPNGGIMVCEFCEGQTKNKLVKRQHWLHGKLYLVENVEAKVCSECGKRYFHVKTIEKLNHLLEAEHVIKERLEVEVVSL
jgi:YgiT-type zinc finger domain-containing protein